MLFNLHPLVHEISRLGRSSLCGLLGWWLAQAAIEAQPEQNYSNNGNNYYYDNVSPGLPTIQATNFYNDSVFSVTYATYKTKTAVYYKFEDTINFTNDIGGYMAVNSPLSTNGFINTYNVGFEFDNYEPNMNNDYMAGTFLNRGTIHCDSVLDGNNVLFADGFQFYEITAAGNCLVQATNIINPGTIEASVDGSITMTGQNLDLKHSVLNIENIVELLGTEEIFGTMIYNNVNFNSVGVVGLDTNKDFCPACDLGPTSAQNTDIIYPTPPYGMFITNSGAYFKTDGLGTSNVVYRAVFVENSSPNAPYSVYIDPANTEGILSFEQGAAHVGWAGSFTDPATGITTTNYLYMTDDYAWGASTNVAVIGGVPDNFTFVSSSVPLLTGAIPEGFDFTVPFDDNFITNRYAYMNGELTATSIPTNNIGGLPVSASRIVITANNHLDLTDAIIGGENYLSLTATNQFDGSGGAQIASPYSDLNLGSTNGFMTVTNLLQSGIPIWSGNIQAWSTRWVEVDPTTGITNDFRVLLVNSQLQPTLSPWVHDLTLHATNSLYISDVLNVYGSLYFDARNLTLTTNAVGFGSTSFDGELNALFAGNIGPVNWPNLLYVTNNGAIRSQNQIVFTNAMTYGAVINNGLIMDQGTTIYASNFVSGGIISNGVGNFTVRSLTTTLTNGFVSAGGGVSGGSISITANNLLISNVPMQCLTLTLNPSNSLSDGGPGTNNGNIWIVGATNATSGGLSLLSNPANGDLLGTTITNICPGPNKTISDIWAGRDFGISSSGYLNNAALGHLVLDVEGNLGAGHGIQFGGTGVSNALYVDALEVRGLLTNCVNAEPNNTPNTVSVPSGISYDFSQYLAINTNLVIYFAQAYWNGNSIAESIETASLEGGNGGIIRNGVVQAPGRLRWVPSYAGFFSSTNIVVAGMTNAVNAALAESGDIDSNGSGSDGYPTYNNSDPATHIFVPQLLDFMVTVTNQPSRRSVLTWNTIPFATNYVSYATNLLTPAADWAVYTNFPSISAYGSSYPVSVFDTNITHGTRFYKVVVEPMSVDSWLSQ
jgi:hypothetical protein